MNELSQNQTNIFILTILFCVFFITYINITGYRNPRKRNFTTIADIIDIEEEDNKYNIKLTYEINGEYKTGYRFYLKDGE